MKINIILPVVNLSGGVRVIAIYADMLTKRGHQVTVVSPGKRKLTFRNRIKTFIRENRWKDTKVFCTDYFDESNVDLKILDSYRPVNESDVPDADILIATFWLTAEWISNYSSKKGKKIYFIQGYEVFPDFPIERVMATYKLPFKKITISKWLVEVLEKHNSFENITLIPNGVDIKQFTADEREKNTTLTVGLVYNVANIKGCDVALKSIDIAKNIVPNIKLVAFGHNVPTKQLSLPTNTEYFYQPDQNEIKHIYAKCDTWLFPSRSEGFGLPILEAMACRTPVIGTTAGAAPEILGDGAGIIVNIDDEKMMAEAIIRIHQMTNSDWKTLSNKVYNIAIQYTWDKSVILFEQALLSVLKK